MPKIKLKIGGRPYEISCNSGDEERVLSLAESVDARACKVANNLVQASENMVLVVTALMMEDEIRNLSRKVEENAAPKQSDLEITDRIDRAIAEALEPFTQKLEALATSLEIG
jgi:cell division protein ZapA